MDSITSNDYINNIKEKVKELDYKQYQMYIGITGFIVITTILLLILRKYLKRRYETQQWINQTMYSRQPSFVSLNASVTPNKQSLIGERQVSICSNGPIPSESLPQVYSRMEKEENDFNSGVDAFEKKIEEAKQNESILQQSLLHQSDLEHSYHLSQRSSLNNAN
ncbi:hypothetical protein EDI_252650 [Entamoeba dispar SAW760]|uniref:Uncharacterized protein n=1 Tax=Entamoeba dispar (strain ATCC PRA-260 / SAW760) TaxID=370354 RepID=B0EF70_ENTDS|nr:uncharacterized protein EDI_252650 [Entamoeba dispar SAW760]EDR26800.1 hypothetical protein EDI_252650 [Entamoeba dispar SAW760]|eukprot:EDR26800.1 hypothetical protein EDI_252650 [Entamoeba dispar SAW760]